MGWGDELMMTGRAREAQATDPRKVRIIYEKPRWNILWDNNPRIAQRGESGDFQELQARDGYLRPYMTKKTDQKWFWKPYRPPRGEVYFTRDEMAFGAKYPRLLIVEPNVKAGVDSPKDWGWRKWQMLARMLQDMRIPVTQIGPSHAPKLSGVDFLVTGTPRAAAAVLATARLAIVPEGLLHHLAAAVGCPAVVIYGGFISPAVTGYDEQRGIFTGSDLGCGMRVACGHCRKCMDAIKPEDVVEHAVQLLEAPLQ